MITEETRRIYGAFISSILCLLTERKKKDRERRLEPSEGLHCLIHLPLSLPLQQSPAQRTEPIKEEERDRADRGEDNGAREEDQKDCRDGWGTSAAAASAAGRRRGGAAANHCGDHRYRWRVRRTKGERPSDPDPTSAVHEVHEQCGSRRRLPQYDRLQKGRSKNLIISHRLALCWTPWEMLFPHHFLSALSFCLEHADCVVMTHLWEGWWVSPPWAVFSWLGAVSCHCRCIHHPFPQSQVAWRQACVWPASGDGSSHVSMLYLMLGFCQTRCAVFLLQGWWRWKVLSIKRLAIWLWVHQSVL